MFRSGEEGSTEIEFSICNVEVAFKKSLTAIGRVQGCGSTFAVGEKKSTFTCFA